MEEYVDRLKLFCESDLKHRIDGNHLIIQIDNETVYDYDFHDYTVTYSERNNESEIGHWDNRKIGDFHFAQLIRSALGKGIVYEDASPYEMADSLEELSGLIKKRFSNTLFSIGEIRRSTISLTNTNNYYQIEFVDREGCHILEKGEEKGFIFVRFFNEILFLEHLKNSLETYRSIFDLNLPINYTQEV